MGMRNGARGDTAWKAARKFLQAGSKGCERQCGLGVGAADRLQDKEGMNSHIPLGD